MGKLFVTVFAEDTLCRLDKNCKWSKGPNAPFSFTGALHRDLISATYLNCTAIAPELNKTCTMMAKTAPYPPGTGTTFWLKYQDPARMRRRVTQPPHIAGPFAVCKKQYI